MTGKVHCIVGVSTAVALTICHPEFSLFGATIYPAIGVVAAAGGSYLPDIDIEQSKLGSKHKWLSKHLTHRGITHTLLVPAILVLLQWLTAPIPVLPSLVLGFNVGYICHIIADLFNKKGVPLLWPLVKEKIHIACVKTASTAQQVLFIIFWEVLLLIWISIRYDILNLLRGLFA